MDEVRYSLCRHCRKPLNSHEIGVCYLPFPAEGAYYQHGKCLSMRGTDYPLQGTAADRTAWHAHWRETHPLPPILTAAQHAVVLARLQQA